MLEGKEEGRKEGLGKKDSESAHEAVVKSLHHQEEDGFALLNPGVFASTSSRGKKKRSLHV